MIKNLKWILIAAAGLAGLYLVNQSIQKRYTTRSTAVFPEALESISRVTISKGEDQITLVRESGEWTLADHDSLVIKARAISSFTDQVLKVQRETMVSKNEQNWGKFSVDDSTGTHVLLFDESGKQTAQAIFGRSQTDWAHNYVRLDGDPEVFLTDGNILHLLSTRPNYWGEKPKPVEPDTTGIQEE